MGPKQKRQAHKVGGGKQDPAALGPSTTTSPVGELMQWKTILKRSGAWLGGIIVAFLATFATAHVTGVLERILPGPASTICRLVENPYLERPLTEPLPGILVATFAGAGGAEAASSVAGEIRFRTGLPTLRTCVVAPLTAGPDASEDSTGKALDSARNLATRLGARLIVFGEMRGEESVELSVANTAEFEGLGNAERIRVRFSGSESSGSNTDINSFIDNQLLSELVEWADTLVLRMKPSDMEASEAEAASIKALTEYRPAQVWEALEKQEWKFSSDAVTAYGYIARSHEECGAAREKFLLASRFSVVPSLDATVVLASLEQDVYCEDDASIPIPAPLSPYIKELATTEDPVRAEQIIKSERPWPSDYGADPDYADVVLARALLAATAKPPDRTKTEIQAALNLLGADVRRNRRRGVPTKEELLSSSTMCQEIHGYTIETTDSWQTLVSQGIDPAKVMADVELPPDRCWKN